jgi:hypothetical protein
MLTWVDKQGYREVHKCGTIGTHEDCAEADG